MRLLDRYIVFTSVFALFTEAFYFNFIIDLKLYYLILISNFILLSLNKKIIIQKNLLLILGFFIVHGVIMYSIFLNPIKSLISQLLGISISSIFYSNLFKYYGNKNVYDVYLKVAFYIALLAIPMFLLKINVFSADRLNGILSEPAHYAAIMLPALYTFLRDKKYLKMSVILLTVLLAKSSVGYVGLALILLLPLLKIKYFIKYAFLSILFFGASFYYIGSKWNESIDENKSNKLVRRLKETGNSLNAISTGKFKQNTNLSSYAVISHSFITKKIFENKPLGTGLGSYQYEYDKYYPLLSPPDYIKTLKLSKINRTDANSLFLRISANFGVFAILFFLYFIYRCVNVFKNDKKLIQQSSFFYLIIKLIREGHYFSPEFYFFLLIFLNPSDEDITHS